MKKITHYFLILAVMLSLPLTAQDPPAPARNKPRPGADKPPPIYLTEEQESEAEKFLKEENPELYARLQKMKQNNPKQLRRMISDVWRRREHLLELEANDPDRYAQVLAEKQLETKTNVLVEEYRRTNTDAQRKVLKEQIIENLKTLFDYRQVNREAEIEKLEKRLAELKESNLSREKNKEIIVQKRLEQLLGKPDDLMW